MFKGLRVEEGKVLEEYISIDEFRYYLQTNQLNLNILKQPNKNNNKKNIWMVTTSDDVVINKEKYLIKEGSYYKLPKGNKIKYWYSTSENKKYKPGTKIRVWTGMHFEKISY